MDLIIRNARLAGRDGPNVDIGIEGGMIRAVEPGLAAEGDEMDAGGHLASPGLVESHFHLDKALIVDRAPPPSDRQTRDHMQRTAAIKHTFTVEDIYDRARRTLEQCVLNGVTHMRTHVEVDPNVGMKGFDAIAQLADDYRWAIDLELCVFLQEGWTSTPGAEENIVAGLRRGAPVVGGAPRYDPDRAGQIDRIFALAQEYDVHVDIHLDGGHDTSEIDVYKVCDHADRLGWGERVAIGHGSKYASLPPEPLRTLGKRLGEAGVAVAVLPATDLFNNGRHMDHNVLRGVADANTLVGLGANCSISTNNVLNPFTPFGDCSLVRIANMYANTVQRGTKEDLAEIFAMITDRPARIMRRSDYGIAPGNPADLVLWNVDTPSDVIAAIAQPVAGFKRGRRTFLRSLPYLQRP
ncbi:MAG: amidohydrolase family protein [Proteobacteria bacterium]|nr:amidohydrolase family protein [Pseudomonadota bacterium]